MELIDVTAVKSLADMEWFLMSNLRPSMSPPPKDGWIQIMGFRRAFAIHGLYRNIHTNAFAFHVTAEHWEWGDSPPNFGIHSTFSDCIRGVAMAYLKLWNPKKDPPFDFVFHAHLTRQGMQREKFDQYANMFITELLQWTPQDTLPLPTPEEISSEGVPGGDLFLNPIPILHRLAKARQVDLHWVDTEKRAKLMSFIQLMITYSYGMR